MKSTSKQVIMILVGIFMYNIGIEILLMITRNSIVSLVGGTICAIAGVYYIRKKMNKKRVKVPVV